MTLVQWERINSKVLWRMPAFKCHEVRGVLQQAQETIEKEGGHGMFDVMGLFCDCAITATGPVTTSREQCSTVVEVDWPLPSPRVDAQLVYSARGPLSC